MLRNFRKHWNRTLLRPVGYMAFTRLILAFLAMGLWQKFVNSAGIWPMLSTASPALCAIFFLFAWFIFLRFDGLHMPRFLRRKPREKNRKLFRGGMMDAAEEETYTFEELSEEEDDCCAFVANLCCAFLFLILSFV